MDAPQLACTTWTLPSPPRGVPRATLGGWALAGVVTIQSGSALTIADTNSTNVFGISRDRAQLTGNYEGAISNGRIGRIETGQLFQHVVFHRCPTKVEQKAASNAAAEQHSVPAKAR